MATALDVFNKAHPMTVSEQDIVDGSIRGAKMAAEVNAKNDARRADAGWRQELEELSRRFPMETVGEAEAKVSGLKSSVAAAVKDYKEKIAACRETLKEKYLTPAEQTHVSQKIEVLTGELSDFKRQADIRLRFAEGRLDSVRQFDHERARWEELKKRAAFIEKALHK